MREQPEFHDRMLSLGLARVSEAAALARSEEHTSELQSRI